MTELHWLPEMPDWRSRLRGLANAPGLVWENAVALKKLPNDLFRGEMDAWCEVTDGRQRPTFIGALRRELQVDKAALEKLEM